MLKRAPKPTKYVLMLAKALKKRGIIYTLEHNDGYKHVDIYILNGKIYIEVDGLQHDVTAEQIVSDFKREYYSSRDGFFTKHITNEHIENHLDAIADAIAKVSNSASNKK